MPRLLISTVIVLFAFTACSNAQAEDLGAPSPGTPTLPAATQSNGTEGAKAFAEHYVETLNYARTSGDLNGLAPLEDVDCGSCQALRHSIAQVYDNGGTITGGSWTMRNPAMTKDGDSWKIAGQIKVARQKVTGTADDDVVAADTVDVAMTISRATGVWKVLECVREV